MTDDMLGPSPMHVKYSSYVYDGFCIWRTNFPGPIESVISKFTCTCLLQGMSTLWIWIQYMRKILYNQLSRILQYLLIIDSEVKIWWGNHHFYCWYLHASSYEHFMNMNTIYEENIVWSALKNITRFIDNRLREVKILYMRKHCIILTH